MFWTLVTWKSRVASPTQAGWGVPLSCVWQTHDVAQKVAVESFVCFGGTAQSNLTSTGFSSGVSSFSRNGQLLRWPTATLFLKHLSWCFISSHTSSSTFHLLNNHLVSINLPFSPRGIASISTVAALSVLQQTGKLGAIARHDGDGWGLLSRTKILCVLEGRGPYCQKKIQAASSWGVLQLLESFVCLLIRFTFFKVTDKNLSNFQIQK